jgi:hypothetical protein
MPWRTPPSSPRGVTVTADPLHERLLALIDEYVTSMQADDYPATWPLDALRAVVERHAPVEDRIGDTLVGLECHGCDTGGGYDPDWPCSTIQDVARELGVPSV